MTFLQWEYTVRQKAWTQDKVQRGIGFGGLPGEQTLEKSLDIHLWVGHNSCVQIQKVNSAVPVEKHKRVISSISYSVRRKEPIKSDRLSVCGDVGTWL